MSDASLDNEGDTPGRATILRQGEISSAAIRARFFACLPFRSLASFFILHSAHDEQEHHYDRHDHADAGTAECCRS